MTDLFCDLCGMHAAYAGRPVEAGDMCPNCDHEGLFWPNGERPYRTPRAQPRPVATDVAQWLTAMAAFAEERCESCGRTRDNHRVRHRWVGTRVAPAAPSPERLRLAADLLDGDAS